MAGETVETTDHDASRLSMSDFARIALRRHFEDGEASLRREATPSLLGNVGDAVSTVPSRRHASGAASLLDAMLYDDASAPIYTSLDGARNRSRELALAADDQ